MSLELATRSSVDLLPLGTRVSYHHRAAVARYKPHPWRNSYKHVDDRPKGWILVGIRWGDLQPGFTMDSLKDMFFDWPRSRGEYYENNKTVMVWPEDGFGTIMGIVRKGIGKSERGRSSMGEWEPGFFIVDMYVDLYALKLGYEGTDFILCPLWSVKELSDGNG